MMLYISASFKISEPPRKFSPSAAAAAPSRALRSSRPAPRRSPGRPLFRSFRSSSWPPDGFSFAISECLGAPGTSLGLAQERRVMTKRKPHGPEKCDTFTAFFLAPKCA